MSFKKINLGVVDFKGENRYLYDIYINEQQKEELICWLNANCLDKWGLEESNNIDDNFIFADKWETWYWLYFVDKRDSVYFHMRW